MWWDRFTSEKTWDLLTHLHEVTNTYIFDTCELVGLTRARYTAESSGRFFEALKLRPQYGLKASGCLEGPQASTVFNVLQVIVFMTTIGLRTNRLEQWLSNSHPPQMPPLNPAAMALVDSKSGDLGWIPELCFPSVSHASLLTWGYTSEPLS